MFASSYALTISQAVSKGTLEVTVSPSAPVQEVAEDGGVTIAMATVVMAMRSEIFILERNNNVC